MIRSRRAGQQPAAWALAALMLLGCSQAPTAPTEKPKPAPGDTCRPAKCWPDDRPPRL